MRILFTTLITLLALPVYAFEPCEATFDEVTETIQGNWQVLNTVGFAQMSGKVVPLPSGNSSTAQIDDTGLGFEISSPMIGVQSVPLTVSSNRIYTLDFVGDELVEAEDAVFEGLSLAGDILAPSDAAFVFGCGPENLPMLQAIGSVIDPESGTNIAVNLTLFVLFEDLMYGVTSGKTPIGFAKRVIRFSR